jgi:SAM-dependent methyltransferase
MTAGVRQIVRFNWPFYVGGIASIIVATWLIAQLPALPVVRAAAWSAAAVAGFWILGSLGASWVVYDLSELTRWNWVVRTIGRPPGWISIHAGLDTASRGLRRSLGGHGRVLDIFDPVEMTEASIVRAREADTHSEHVDFRALPVAGESVEAALLMLSAHELRSEAARVTLFTELRRALTPDGRVIVAEHLRDVANFIVFGPGALHFHSRRTWTHSFAASGLTIASEFAITPFVRVFVLRKAS